MMKLTRVGRPAAVLIGGLALGLGLSRCGAEGTPMPERSTENGEPSGCKSLQGYMPNFFEMMRDPKQPLKGLATVVTDLTTGDGTKTKGDPIAAVLNATIKGLKSYTNDPWEVKGSQPARCHPATDQNPLPAGPLCTVEPAQGSFCENRVCTVKRAIDFAVRNQAANDALAALKPLLVKILGYVTNTDPGADGKEHYEGFSVLEQTMADEAACPPEPLLSVLDGVIIYFRSDATCSADKSCLGQKAVALLHDMLADPQLDAFLSTFEASQGGAKGRAGFITLSKTLVNTLANMPEDETYFDQVDGIVNTVLVPFFDKDPVKYGGLKTKTLQVVSMLKGLMDPARPGAILKPLKRVLTCLGSHDENGEIVGVLYDLVSKPGGPKGNGVDLLELIVAVEKVVDLDTRGALAGLLHAILRSTISDEVATDALRILLKDILTVNNAKLMMPALRTMIDKDVLPEIVTVVDNISSGCKGEIK